MAPKFPLVMRLSVSSPRWSGWTRHPMSDNRQAAWRRRRSSSVSRKRTTRTSRSVHSISSWAWRADRDSNSFSVCAAPINPSLAPAAGLELGDIGNFGLDDPLGALQRLVRQILQRQTSERQRHPAANPIAPDVDQFQRSAAEIANDAVRLVNTGNDAQRREFGFA